MPSKYPIPEVIGHLKFRRQVPNNMLPKDLVLHAVVFRDGSGGYLEYEGKPTALVDIPELDLTQELSKKLNTYLRTTYSAATGRKAKW